MKIFNLTTDSKLYTANVYLVLGTWNTVEDINTLVDVGSDPSIIPRIEITNTGLGKRKVDQVILTHSHSDHSAMLSRIKELYNPRIYAFNAHLKGVDVVLKDGDYLHIGEQFFEVFHITSHSYDSICLYGDHDNLLFSGDTTFPIEFENETLKNENAQVLARLRNKLVKKIYPGHGNPHEYKDGKFHLTVEELSQK